MVVLKLRLVIYDGMKLAQFVLKVKLLKFVIFILW